MLYHSIGSKTDKHMQVKHQIILQSSLRNLFVVLTDVFINSDAMVVVGEPDALNALKSRFSCNL
jgi:hypothetical protein